MAQRVVLVAVAVLAWTACESDQGATPTPMPSPSASVSPAATIALTGEAPVLEPSSLGDGHYGYILPAAYFMAEGLRHAYVVGFGEERGDQEVFHVTSSDGLAWQIDDDPPFAELGLELSPPGPIPSSVNQAADGTWVMYLWGVPAPQVEGSVIYRATAPSPDGPWVAEPEPDLTPGAPGSGTTWPRTSRRWCRWVTAT